MAASRDRKQDELQGAGRKSRMRTFLSYSFTFIILGAACGILALLFMRSQALPVSKMAAASELYDVHGKPIEAYGGGKSTQTVPLKQMSPNIIEATLAIEDRSFYNHYGFDPKGIARAALVNLQHMSKVQGAGTITQQLARNLYLNHERTWSRKLKETYFAVQMELQMSKDQILEQYLNQIYYGHSTYGIQAASQLFFGKNASELSLAESALLAGVPKGPRYYSPYYDMASALDRQKTVLGTMVESGYITQAEADRAAAEKLNILPLEAKKTAVTAPYFRDYIRSRVIDLLGLEENEYEEMGLRIYTTLDLNAQQIAEETIKKELEGYPELQTALIAIDPRNGYVKAMVGGRSYAENQYNRVFANTRQPGSSFKPIVYLTALREKQYTPVTRFVSEPTTFSYDKDRKKYTPNNYDGKFYGPIDLRAAMSKSDNIFAVHTILETGPERVIETARSMGITSPMQPLPSLALGTFPVSPFEMASAFTIFANQGVRVEPTAIVRIEDRRGRILYESAPSQTAVVEPTYAYVMTHLMESVFDQGGTGSRVSNVLKRPVAGKTGTTDTDAWMVGYTPELTTAVWIGYDKGRDIGTVEAHLAAPIFAEFTEKALASVPPKMFTIPEGVVHLYIDPATGKLANDSCPKSRMEAFVQGTEPREYCTSEPVRDELPQPDQEKAGSSWWNDLKRWWSS
ncbi:penicillin-binding protein, 1A family [Paenibacillus sp. UNCCL117]|uniref:transglycosylase domain-containing protein n=1 Tax=unclassified Paenibacillus TaxID=185978 RepID=UPI0008868F84|nr:MULTISPECIES: PBP1A family penicillin-binding protein [unclassified Paenibacillus]SDD19087.1 penicillin-binding protein, 1A family [Paenibacillus sp. cl123]SFW35413.1 penicillin-binding protein, 1A family [Paenibacillus sp. UNCCL117]